MAQYNEQQKKKITQNYKITGAVLHQIRECPLNNRFSRSETLIQQA
jgi:hypothetical protein